MSAGTGEHGTRLALDLTARLAFVPFWTAYSGGSLALLFGSAFQPLRRNARELGLAFAAMEVVHLALVGWLCVIGHAPSVRTFLVFGFAILWTYLLALFSIADMQRLLSARAWWVMRAIGMNYIAYAFAKDFLSHPGLDHAAFYWPFAALAVIGPGLRLVTTAQRLRRHITSRDRRRA